VIVSTISSNLEIAALLVILLLLSGRIFFHNLLSKNYTLNWFLVSLFGLPLLVIPLKSSYEFLNYRFVASASNADVILILTQITLGFLNLIRYTGFARKKGNSFPTLNLFSGIPLASACLALIYALTTGQGWLQPVYCILIFGIGAFLRFDYRELKISLLLSLNLGIIGQILSIVIGNNVSQCRADKCIIFSSILNVDSAGNGFGVRILLLTLPLLMIANRAEKPSVLLISFSLILLSGSRTALITLFITFLLYVFIIRVQLVPRHSKISLVSGLVVALTVLPVFREFDQRFLTLRGDLWARGRALLSESPFIGHGPSYWVRLNGQDSFFANYGAHNLWMDSGIAFGIIGTLILSTWLIVGYREMRIRSDYFVISLLGLVLSASVESTLTFWTFGFAIPLLIILVSAEDERNEMSSSFAEGK